MDIINCREYILTLPCTEECQPFGDDILVYKIGGKMFAAISLQRADYIALKCNPDRAVLLREQYPAITPAWHFNKRHWNDLVMTRLNDEILKREIRHSYFTVVNKLSPKSLREQILSINTNKGIADDTEML